MSITIKLSKITIHNLLYRSGNKTFEKYFSSINFKLWSFISNFRLYFFFSLPCIFHNPKIANSSYITIFHVFYLQILIFSLCSKFSWHGQIKFRPTRRAPQNRFRPHASHDSTIWMINDDKLILPQKPKYIRRGNKGWNNSRRWKNENIDMQSQCGV